jgi:archaellin
LTVSGESAAATPVSVSYANCYGGSVSDNGGNNPYLNTLDTLVTIVNGTTAGDGYTSASGATQCALFIGNSNNNTSLDSDEKGFLVFWFAPGDRAVHGQTIYAEIRPEQGAPISISFVVSAQLQQGWSTVGT